MAISQLFRDYLTDISRLLDCYLTFIFTHSPHRQPGPIMLKVVLKVVLTVMLTVVLTAPVVAIRTTMFCRGQPMLCRSSRTNRPLTPDPSPYSRPLPLLPTRIAHPRRPNPETHHTAYRLHSIYPLYPTYLPHISCIHPYKTQPYKTQPRVPSYFTKLSLIQTLITLTLTLTMH